MKELLQEYKKRSDIAKLMNKVQVRDWEIVEQFYKEKENGQQGKNKI